MTFQTCDRGSEREYDIFRKAPHSRACWENFIAIDREKYYGCLIFEKWKRTRLCMSTKAESTTMMLKVNTLVDRLSLERAEWSSDFWREGVAWSRKNYSGKIVNNRKSVLFFSFQSQKKLWNTSRSESLFLFAVPSSCKSTKLLQNWSMIEI